MGDYSGSRNIYSVSSNGLYKGTELSGCAIQFAIPQIVTLGVQWQRFEVSM